ncbi:MAG: LysM peptidoglycan-binding domain-containing protein, partial [Anaerolineae bacterium]|nr:LysM peptidoglycan-binding domain-containing protein [Anaerolineae bacterium]
AKRFDTTVEALLDANDIQNPDLIYIGQALIIPGEYQPLDMTIRIIEHGVRLRSAPDFGSNVIVLLGKDTEFGNASLSGDWWQVQCQGTSGYIHMSMVEMVVPNPDPVVPPNVIVYRSQWDVDASNRVNDCGQTCVAMLAGSRGVYVKINDLPYQSTTTGISSADDLVRNFNHLGLTTARVVNLPLSSRSPRNSICLIWYGGLERNSVQDKGFTDWHWVIFLRTTRNRVVVHDPDFWRPRRDEGAEKQYSKAEWNAAFIPYGSGSTRTCVELV